MDREFGPELDTLRPARGLPWLLAVGLAMLVAAGIWGAVRGFQRAPLVLGGLSSLVLLSALRLWAESATSCRYRLTDDALTITTAAGSKTMLWREVTRVMGQYVDSGPVCWTYTLTDTQRRRLKVCTAGHEPQADLATLIEEKTVHVSDRKLPEAAARPAPAPPVELSGEREYRPSAANQQTTQITSLSLASALFAVVAIAVATLSMRPAGDGSHGKPWLMVVVIGAGAVGVTIHALRQRRRAYRVDAEGLTVVGPWDQRRVQWPDVVRVRSEVASRDEGGGAGVVYRLVDSAGRRVSVSTVGLLLAHALELEARLETATATVADNQLCAAPTRVAANPRSALWSCRVIGAMMLVLGLLCGGAAVRFGHMIQRDLPWELALRDHPAFVIGVAEPLPGDAQRVSARYRVDGHEYTCDLGQSGRFDTPRVGQEVRLAYVPERPSYAHPADSLSEPLPTARQMLTFVGVFLVSGAACVLFGLWCWLAAGRCLDDEST